MKKKTKISRTNKITKWWVPILLSMVMLFYGIKNTYHNIILENQGECVSAIIVDSYKTGLRTRRNIIKYIFKVNGITYSGDERSLGKIGDTISVLYLPNNPKKGDCKLNCVSKK